MALTSKTTQNFIPIEDIHEGVVTLKNGSLRMVLMVSSINFALKGEDEQVAILLQFQNFLNSIDFSVQIMIQSRKLDINPYLSFLNSNIEEISNELIKIQAREYIEFIKNLTDNVNIMSKNFFVVIPYATTTISKGGSGIINKILGKKDVSSEDKIRFEEHKTQLEQRSLVIEQGLSSIGLRAARLGTEELIELFYKAFNPQDKNKPPVLKEK